MIFDIEDPIRCMKRCCLSINIVKQLVFSVT